HRGARARSLLRLTGGASLHSCGAHAVHHPAAFTCLPGNSWHGPWVEPAAPWYRPQLAQLLPAVAPLACRASSSYFSARASGAPTAVRRCSLVTAPRLMANDSTTCCPLRSPRLVVSMKAPVALRLTALQSLRRPPGAVM